MKLLITGGSGQLGSELIRQLTSGGSSLGEIPDALKGAEVHAPSRAQLDISDESRVRSFISDLRPDAVIHCAAMSNVEGCEDVPDQCLYVNGTSAAVIAEECEKCGAKLMFLSTDYVFSGDSSVPYRTDDLCAPLSAYGKSKRVGEINAVGGCSRAFVVRTSWLYGTTGSNFVRTILRKAREAGSLKVVNDQFGSPTNAVDLAFQLLKLIVTDKYGIYHCTGTGICSWYDFAEEIIALSGLECRVTPCSSAEYPQKAARPHWSALDNSAAEELTGWHMRHWKEALKDHIQRLEERA